MLITVDSYTTVPGTSVLSRVPDLPISFKSTASDSNPCRLRKAAMSWHCLLPTLLLELFLKMFLNIYDGFGCRARLACGNNCKHVFRIKFLCLQQHWMNRIGVYSHPHFFRS
jgi:hypothetical protein